MEVGRSRAVLDKICSHLGLKHLDSDLKQHSQTLKHSFDHFVL